MNKEVYGRYERGNHLTARAEVRLLRIAGQLHDRPALRTRQRPGRGLDQGRIGVTASVKYDSAGELGGEESAYFSSRGVFLRLYGRGEMEAESGGGYLPHSR